MRYRTLHQLLFVWLGTKNNDVAIRNISDTSIEIVFSETEDPRRDERGGKCSLYQTYHYLIIRATDYINATVSADIIGNFRGNTEDCGGDFLKIEDISDMADKESQALVAMLDKVYDQWLSLIWDGRAQ